MKKLIIPISVILISGLIVLNYLYFKMPKKDLIISQNKTYGLYNTRDFNVYLYANRKNAYLKSDAIENSSIHNLEETKKLPLELKEITKLDSYPFLEQTFTCYNYYFNIPYLDQYFFISDAYLTLELKNGEYLTVKIGSFDYYPLTETVDFITLYGKRYADIPALKEITFSLLLNETITIEKVSLSNQVFVTLSKELTSGEALTVELPPQTQISDQLAIKVEYLIDDQKYFMILPYYRYYDTNENPLLYRELNYIYDLNQTS